MKTQLLQTSIIVLSLFTAQMISAQTGATNMQKSNDYSYVDLSKIDPVISSTGTALATESVNNKISKSFKKYFGEQAEQNWSIVGTNFLNRFNANGVLTNSMFNKNGNLVYTITYGTDQNMPDDIKHTVKSEYYDYNITMAINIQENKRNIWVIKLENEQQQITIRIEDGEMEQVQKFTLSK